MRLRIADGSKVLARSDKVAVGAMLPDVSSAPTLLPFASAWKLEDGGKELGRAGLGAEPWAPNTPKKPVFCFLSPVYLSKVGHTQARRVHLAGKGPKGEYYAVASRDTLNCYELLTRIRDWPHGPQQDGV